MVFYGGRNAKWFLFSLLLFKSSILNFRFVVTSLSICDLIAFLLERLSMRFLAFHMAKLKFAASHTAVFWTLWFVILKLIVNIFVVSMLLACEMKLWKRRRNHLLAGLLVSQNRW